MDRRILAALACCGLLTLAGCSDGSSSTAPPTPSPTSESSSSSPSATETEEAETPEDFVERWVAADTEMQNSGDTSVYRELSRQCNNCQEYADHIDEIYDAGGYVETEGWLIRKSKTSQALPSGQIDVTIAVTSTPAEYVEETGGPVKTYEEYQLSYIVSIKPDSAGNWVATNFAQVAQ